MTIENRFYSKVLKTDDCWIWQASCYENGYGAFRIGNFQKKAHRVSWELTNGKIPDKMQINHTCDNKLCVNPEHLYIGTQKQNREDSVNRGRTATGKKNGMYTHPETRQSGEKNFNCKITDLERKEIKNKYEKGMGNALAKQYGITRQSIWQIIHSV